MTIPDKSLVGQNAVLKNDIYTDDYLRALNAVAPVDEVFGRHKKAIARGESIVGKLVMDTLGKTEYEHHLVTLVMTAAKTGQWSAVKRAPWNLSGLEEVIYKKFGHVAIHEKETFLLPSLTYVAYCKDTL